ncbi:MAG: serine/threonine-protein kinase [Terriglobales bacterium]|jgi:serine/threonine protein kinase
MNAVPETLSARWEAIKKIFEAAMEEPPGDRPTFVRTACGGDTELESGVLMLLESNEEAGSFLEKAPVSAGRNLSGKAPPPPLLATGSIVSGRFQIIRFIGQGGMAQVYEAFDSELKERIALKAIRPDISSDARVLARFRREVQLTRHITHPNVCRVFDFDRDESGVEGTARGVTFLTMELLEGETLAGFLSRRGRLSATEAAPLIRQMVEGLNAAHNAGVVHRDFKPPNVLLVPSGSGLRVVITDFGLARAVQNDSQRSPENALYRTTCRAGMLGTLIYMAPEQLERGEATPATDIYALGLVIYEMFTGQRPFADTIPFVEGVKRIKHPAPSPRVLAPNLDPQWEAAICRCLQTDPKARFESVRQVLEPGSAVEQAVLVLPADAASVNPPPATNNAAGSRPTWAVFIGVLIAAVALLAAVWFLYRQ